MNDVERGDVTDLSQYENAQVLEKSAKNIRIGFCTFDPKGKIYVSTRGIFMIVPGRYCRTEGDFEIHLQKFEVRKLLLSSYPNSNKTCVCVYLTREFMKYVNTHLDICGEAHPEEMFKITENYNMRKMFIEIDSMTENEKALLKSIWSDVLELQCKDMKYISSVYDTLIERYPYGPQSHITTKRINVRELHKVLIYPPGKGGITITLDDYMCLARDQYLNDIIIDFYLKWLHVNVIPEDKKKRTFIFSTFFYKRLTTLTRLAVCNQEKDVKLTAAQKRHLRVQNWTKHVNLFENDFIVIPINEQAHWFLVIICYPGQSGPVTYDTNIPINTIPTNKKKESNKVALQIGNTTITPLNKRDTPIPPNAHEHTNGSDRDEAEGDDSDGTSEGSEHDSYQTASSTSSNSYIAASSQSQGEVLNSTAKSSTANPSTPDKPKIKQPVILVFDSLSGGASRNRVVATLRDYLTCEYKAKMPHMPPHSFNKHNMPGHNVAVPQQDNFTDCGLYLLQYVEKFFTDPIRDYRIPIKQLVKWFDTISVTRKREDIAKLIKTLASDKNNPHKDVVLPIIPLPTCNGIIAPANDSNEEYEDTDDGGGEEEDGNSGSAKTLLNTSKTTHKMVTNDVIPTRKMETADVCTTRKMETADVCTTRKMETADVCTTRKMETADVCIPRKVEATVDVCTTRKMEAENVCAAPIATTLASIPHYQAIPQDCRVVVKRRMALPISIKVDESILVANTVRGSSVPTTHTSQSTINTPSPKLPNRHLPFPEECSDNYLRCPKVRKME